VPNTVVAESTPRIHRFKRNLAGRDFVVADIHGSFDLLVIAMAEIDFNPEIDRIFSTGDLIDRGDSSERCAEFISLPYFHSTLGNHESMLLDLYSRGEPPEEIVKIAASRNGFDWWLKVPQEQRQNILAAVRSLPYVIEVETAIGIVGIIHADVPSRMDWSRFSAAIESEDRETTMTCLWGRDRIDHNDRHGVPGIARVYVGHTPQWQGLTQFGNVFALDTGATFGLQGNYDRGRFTMVSLDADEKHLTANPLERTMIDIRNN
jgi:serine/threonine protein phosphatase 1